MGLGIGIVTVRGGDYHPNRRLLEAAAHAGHRAVLIHPYAWWPATRHGRLVLTGAGAEIPLPQVVIPRQGAQISDSCLALIRHLQLIGLPLVNDATAIALARNKFLTQQVLTAAGVACPDTVFVNAASGFFHAVEQLGGYPVVAKTVSGRQGAGVVRIADAADAQRRVPALLDRRQGVMVQRYHPPEGRRDLRALTIGGRLVCAAALRPAPGEFRANFHLGGEMTPVALSPDWERVAQQAAAAVGCEVAGVDMMVDGPGSPLVVEVNYSPGFKGLEQATGLDIAGRIIAYAVDRCRATP